MARLIKKTNLGLLNVVDIEVAGEIYASENGLINHNSKQCRKLWHDPANIFKPIPYKLSELAEGYNTDMKNPVPTIGKTQPNCRHIASFVPPNFGFDSKGNIQFINFGYDYYSDFKKSQE